MTAEESQKDTPKKLTICVSSRSLLYIEKEFKVYKEQDLDKYIEAMKKREEEPFLDRGAAFPFIHALLKINSESKNPPFDIVLLSNNNAQAGAALTFALRHYNLNIEKIFLTSRDSVIQYLGAFGTVLYLSAKEEDVIEAHKAGYASLQVEPEITSEKKDGDEKINVTIGARFIRFGASKDDVRQCEVMANCRLLEVVNIFEEIFKNLKREKRLIVLHYGLSHDQCELCTSLSVKAKGEICSLSDDPPAKPLAKHERNKQRIPDINKAITVCISSRSLFNLKKLDKIYENDGLRSYIEAMIAHENRPFSPGIAFPFIKALVAVNDKLLFKNPNEKVLFDVVMMSNSSAQAGVALINSINHHKLPIERVCLTAGNSTEYLEAFRTKLFLSADKNAVYDASNKEIAAALIYKGRGKSFERNQLRVVFDGGFVLYENKPGETHKDLGTSEHYNHEFENADIPLEAGPLLEFAKELGKIQKKFTRENCPIRTYVVSRRFGATAGARVILTFRKWGLDIDEVFFLGKMPKEEILRIIDPHIFFDDEEKNLSGSVPGCRVLI